MTNTQRLKNDIATIERRETTDNLVRDSRLRNDEITAERRDKMDEAVDERRIRNDEKTANRREMKDSPNLNMGFAVFLLILIALAIGAFFLFI